MDEQVMQETTDDLAERVAAAYAKLTLRSQRFAEALAAGRTIVDAAREVGLSTKRGAPYKHASEPRVAALVLLLGEQARRAAAFTAEQAITRFRDISDRAYEAGEWGDATGALREAAKVGGLYPQDAAGGASAAPVVVQVALALPPRETPPSYLAAGATVALPPPPAAPAALPERAAGSGATGTPSSELSTPDGLDPALEELLE